MGGAHLRCAGQEVDGGRQDTRRRTQCLLDRRRARAARHAVHAQLCGVAGCALPQRATFEASVLHHLHQLDLTSTQHAARRDAGKILGFLCKVLSTDISQRDKKSIAVPWPTGAPGKRLPRRRQQLRGA